MDEIVEVERVRFRCALREPGICAGTCTLPQWCFSCKRAHQTASELKQECRIGPTCYPCEEFLHDEAGASFAPEPRPIAECFTARTPRR